MALIPKIITDAASIVAFQIFLDKFEYKLSLYYYLGMNYISSSLGSISGMTFERVAALYEDKTKTSKMLFDRAKKVFAGGVNHNIRFFRPYPFFSERAKGRYLIDVDGNKYTDYWMGHWSLILGHSPRVIVRALSRQLDSGTLYGTANVVSLCLGELIQKLMPNAERVRFSSTGSEATMYAVRLARAWTRKRKVAKAIGGWHGFNTTLMHTVNYPFHEGEGSGLLAEERKSVESLPFNDLDASIRILEGSLDDLACIILEPILAGAGCIPPEPGYLKGLQEFAQRRDIIFILDEIVTGFRLSPGGAALRYNLDPDLFTLGKIVGGGMPIGAVCGKKELLEQADFTVQDRKHSRCAIGGGTYSCNPLTMVAGLATIKYLEKNKNKLYQRINELGDRTRRGLTKIFTEGKIDVQVTGEGSLFLTHFLNDKVRQVKDALDAATSDQQQLYMYHMALMALHRIFFLPSKMGAISFAHSNNDITRLLQATQSIVDSGILSFTGWR